MDGPIVLIKIILIWIHIIDSNFDFELKFCHDDFDMKSFIVLWFR